MKFNLKKLFGAVGVVSVALALGGCANTPHTAQKNLELFDVGEQVTYMNVTSVRKDLPENSLCKNKENPILSEEGREEGNKLFCGKEKDYQLVVGAHYNGPIKGVMFSGVMVPKSVDVGVDDILKYTMNYNADGKLARPHVFNALVKKDGAKEPKDCYWEGGKRMTGAFARGGIVCEGWDWKKQKFAQ